MAGVAGAFVAEAALYVRDRAASLVGGVLYVPQLGEQVTRVLARRHGVTRSRTHAAASSLGRLKVIGRDASNWYSAERRANSSCCLSCSPSIRRMVARSVAVALCSLAYRAITE